MFTKIDSILWTDSKYKELSDDGKFLFIYVLTCPHRNILGFYFLPVPYGAFDLGWVPERFTKGLDELFSKGFINYNHKTNMIFIKNFLKYNPLENPNQVKGALKVLDSLPSGSINIEFIELVKSINVTLSKPLLEPLIKGLYKRLPKQVDVDVDVEEEVDVEVVKNDDDINENNLQDLEAHYQVNLKRNSSSKDLQEMLKAYETYKDIEFIKRTMDKAILKNKESHGELTIRSFSYFVPVLKEEWKKKKLGGGSIGENYTRNNGKNKGEDDSAKRAGVISL